MTNQPVRTRFAPSPTGMMHVGNLRSALYEYLIARSAGGSFLLRLEDTDQERFVPDATEAIYRTLRHVGLEYDEGPDIGGPYAPYVQSERLSIYRPYAEQLVRDGHAYRCFCSRERLEQLRSQAESAGSANIGYDRHCRDLPASESERRAAAGEAHVIRQKMPLTGSTTFHDLVYGEITVDNKELDDQVLLKSDGMPTYNYANVIDDHEMAISHVVRGSEYLSSTPKYKILYDIFGWTVPTYVHLPLIVGSDGRKLSKRHGATTLADLEAAGYLPDAIINFIALLGWSPPENRELYTLDELKTVFSVERISKSPAMFDYGKLDWFNSEYIRRLDRAGFQERMLPWLKAAWPDHPADLDLLTDLLQPRLARFSQIPEMLRFLRERLPYDLELFVHRKNKVDCDTARRVLPLIRATLADLDGFDRDAVHDALMAMPAQLGLKTGQLLWPLRIALSGLEATPGGAIEIAVLLGREETLARIDLALKRLS